MGLSNGCWKRIPQSYDAGEKLYLSESVDVRYCLYFLECADLVLDAPLVRYSSAGMSIISLTILYRKVS